MYVHTRHACPYDQTSAAERAGHYAFVREAAGEGCLIRPATANNTAIVVWHPTCPRNAAATFYMRVLGSNAQEDTLL